MTLTCAPATQKHGRSGTQNHYGCSRIGNGDDRKCRKQKILNPIFINKFNGGCNFCAELEFDVVEDAELDDDGGDFIGVFCVIGTSFDETLKGFSSCICSYQQFFPR